MEFISRNSSSDGAAEAARRAAEEARRKAAEEAARLAREEAARLAREEAARQARETARADVRQPAAPPNVFADPSTLRAAPDMSPMTREAVSVADLAGGRPPVPPLPPGVETVTVRPTEGGRALADAWTLAGTDDLGMADPYVFQDYMARNEAQLQKLGDVVATPPPMATVDDIVSGQIDRSPDIAMRAALLDLQAQYPDADIRIGAPEVGALPPGLLEPNTPGVVFEVRENGELQYFALQPFEPITTSVGLSVGIQDVIANDPALLDSWYRASASSRSEVGLDSVADDAASALNYAMSFEPRVVVQGLQGMPAADQAALLQDYAGRHLVPVSLSPENVIASAPAASVMAGVTPASLETTFNLNAVDGLANSTPLPAPTGVSQESWRQTLEWLQQNPPGSIDALETALTSTVLSTPQIEALKQADPGALPAIYSLVTGPPSIGFDRSLNFSLVGPQNGQPANFESVGFETVGGRTYAVVETSVEQLLGDQPDLDATYAVADSPMTLRVPLPAGTTASGSTASPEQLEMINEQLRDIGQASIFLHGYQSDRGVWRQEMQNWMDLANGDTIGIAFAGMGSERDTHLGAGPWALTPQQYGDYTLEALDRLGLWGKDLNVIGHSMGGAAALEMGLAIDDLVAANPGTRAPNMRYVLLAPAVGPDSVPFLTDGVRAGLIDFSNRTGISVGLIKNKIVDDLMPGAPDYIRDVHKGFSDSEQLEATAAGLLHQGYPDPARVRAWQDAHPGKILVVSALEDAIVDGHVEARLFGPDTLVVHGNHYPHLPNGDHPEWTSPQQIFDAAQAVFASGFVRPGRGGGPTNVR